MIRNLTDILGVILLILVVIVVMAIWILLVTHINPRM